MVYSAVSTGSWRLAGRLAIVTGGASGLGLAAAQRLVGEGARVVLADADAAAAEAAAKKLPGSTPLRLDVTDPEAVDAAITAAAKDLGGGRLDIVINNAGVCGPYGTPLHRYPVDEWRRTIDVNLNGAYFTMRAALAQMKRQELQGGVIVNTVSTAGLSGIVGCSPYTASKAALVALTKSAALEYADAGIRVVGVAPTGIKTPMTVGVLKQFGLSEAEAEAALESSTMNPMPGAPKPEHFAAAVAYLVSDEAKWVSGSIIPVDGAYLAGHKPDNTWSSD